MEHELLLQRFNDNYSAEPMSGCWLWLKAVNTYGYGVIRHKAKTLKAHRVSCEYSPA